jgi:hypothetical protein
VSLWRTANLPGGQVVALDTIAASWDDQTCVWNVSDDQVRTYRDTGIRLRLNSTPSETGFVLEISAYYVQGHLAALAAAE